ncbi:MAG: hypothetical protein J3K34DRAFT_447228 [Monoraphidium minutum]|nr:MAG: hypothetical protein J3K34DRAFT_447228 [Monoraphidium minutum]
MISRAYKPMFASAAFILAVLTLYGQAAPKTKAVISGTRPCNAGLNLSILHDMAKSQSKEDIHVWETYFKNLCHGHYLELGALDGVTFSNTYMLSKGLNWTGVLIEANPSSFNQLEVNRPHDTNVNAAVCRQASVVHYANSSHPAVGGIWEFMAPSFRAEWYPNVVSADGMPAIPCVPLQQVIDTTFTHFFDFFSLDVEGGELEVLHSIDFSRTAFGVIVVEADTHAKRKNEIVRTFLHSKGYEYRGMLNNRHNDWFVSQAFHEIYM